ncbi:hypothetical protein QQ045_004451 [Rhodiola kirilowii]
MEANRLRHLPPPQASLPPVSLPAPSHSSHQTSFRLFSTSASDSLRCRSRPDVRKPSWDAAGTERSKFYPYSDLYDDGDDDEGDGGGFFGFSRKKKQRKWWSDDVDDEEDEEEEDEFWGFKILKAFGWMVPAILISMVLGTGPNALFMAVALPLGQTALSLAVNKVWGMAWQTSKPRPGNRTRSKPYASTSDGNRARKREQDAGFASRKQTTSSTSSTGSYEPAQGNGHRATTSFGGWDELDREVEMRPKPSMEEDERKRQKKDSKVSKRVGNRDSPLFIRLLVAGFPFLGSWARFL